MDTRIKIFAPATVANVACGYDILGLALEKPGDEIIARLSDKPGLRITKITGAKGRLPFAVDKNTAGVGALKLMEYLGYKGGIELEIHKKMPFGSGLGSSAASAVAGVMAVNELLKRPLTKRELLPFAVAGEQSADGAYHADNVAPSLIGGIVLIRDNATLDIHQLALPEGLIVVVVYPHIEILTRTAREVLSEKITLKQHIQQSGNLASLVVGLYNSDFDLIRRSLKDVVIEPQRAKLIPSFDAVKQKALEKGALGCSISGAGPSIFAICNNTRIAENVGKAVSSVFTEQGIESDIFISKINTEGAIKF